MAIAKLKEVFGIDVRSLAVFRIAIALIILFDLFIRSRMLVAHYTDFGVLPRADLIAFFANPSWLSIHLISGQALIQAVLFLIAAIFAFALLVGYRTRIVTIVSWFLLISLHSRNPLILQGGDILLRVILFWAMFLPLGAYWSYDYYKSKKQIPKRIFSFGTVGILVQVAGLYVFSAFLKTGKEWFPDGTAIYYALNVDIFATTFGKYLLNFPDLLFYLTYFVYFLELVGPFLLFIPLFFGPIRTAMTFVFFLLVIGMGVTLYLAQFTWIALVAFIVFLPSWFWDKLLPKLKMKKITELLKSRNKFRQSDSIKEGRTKKQKLISHIINFVALFFIIFIFLWNVQTLGVNAVPNQLEFIAPMTRVDQIWNMFSPYPMRDDGWYVIEGRLTNGDIIDIIRDGEPVDWEKPDSIAHLYKYDRWRKYHLNLWQRSNSVHRSYYAKYLCRDWNNNHMGEEQLEELKIFFMREITLPDYETPEIEKIFLYGQVCFNSRK